MAPRLRRSALAAALLVLASCSNEVPLKPMAAVHLTGRILDRDGNGIPGVRVEAYSHGAYGPGSSGKTATDSSGAYALDLLETVYDFRIEPPAASGRSLVYLDGVRLHRSSPHLDYRYTGFRVQVNVVGPGGGFLDSARVFIAGPGEVWVAAVERSGPVTLWVPQSGTYFLGVYPLVDEVPVRTVDLTVQADTTVTVALDGYPITGIVRGRGGAPMESVAVTGESVTEYLYARDRTGPDGSYRIYLPAGSYRIGVHPEGGNSYVMPRKSTLQAIAGPASFDFDLSGTLWSGVVREPNGSPAPNMAVTVGDVSDNSPYGQAHFTTGGDGAYRFVVIPGREYYIMVRPVGGYELRGFIPGIVAGSDSTIDITLDPLTPIAATGAVSSTMRRGVPYRR